MSFTMPDTSAGTDRGMNPRSTSASPRSKHYLRTFAGLTVFAALAAAALANSKSGERSSAAAGSREEVKRSSSNPADDLFTSSDPAEVTRSSTTTTLDGTTTEEYKCVPHDRTIATTVQVKTDHFARNPVKNPVCRAACPPPSDGCTDKYLFDLNVHRYVVRCNNGTQLACFDSDRWKAKDAAVKRANNGWLSWTTIARCTHRNKNFAMSLHDLPKETRASFCDKACGAQQFQRHSNTLIDRGGRGAISCPCFRAEIGPDDLERITCQEDANAVQFEAFCENYKLWLEVPRSKLAPAEIVCAKFARETDPYNALQRYSDLYLNLARDKFIKSCKTSRSTSDQADATQKCTEAWDKSVQRVRDRATASRSAAAQAPVPGRVKSVWDQSWITLNKSIAEE